MYIQRSDIILNLAEVYTQQAIAKRRNTRVRDGQRDERHSQNGGRDSGRASVFAYTHTHTRTRTPHILTLKIAQVESAILIKKDNATRGERDKTNPQIGRD